MNNILKKITNLFFTTTVYYFATLPENIDTFLRKQTVASIEQSIKQCSNAFAAALFAKRYKRYKRYTFESKGMALRAFPFALRAFQ